MSDEAEHRQELPALSRDRAFYGMTATQLLGAFNDNLFKQLVLLICLDYKEQQGIQSDPFQPIAATLFALPFIFYSGFAGYLSDKFSKRTIVVLCKVAEIVVMMAALTCFLAFGGGLEIATSLIVALLIVLFFMGTQSAFFGPSKYGILPELLRRRDLPAANGIVLMTTFLAIILGTACAGFAKDAFGVDLWIASLICIGIAFLGTGTSVLLRRTPRTAPDLKFDRSMVFVSKDTWGMLKQHAELLKVLYVVSLFWLVGAMAQLAVNGFGKVQLGVTDSQTSILNAVLSFGILSGAVVAGTLSKSRVEPWIIRSGAWGLVGFCGLIFLVGVSGLPESATYWAAMAVLLGMGFSTAFFAVPLNTYIQAKPPEGQKGRVIGAMNLLNFTGIMLGGIIYFAASLLETVVGKQFPSYVFLTMGGLMLPIALRFNPPEEDLAAEPPTISEGEQSSDSNDKNPATDSRESPE